MSSTRYRNLAESLEASYSMPLACHKIIIAYSRDADELHGGSTDRKQKLSLWRCWFPLYLSGPHSSLVDWHW